MRISVKHWLRILEIKGMPMEFNWNSIDYQYCNNSIYETDKYFICINGDHRSFIDKQTIRLIFPLGN